MMRDSDAYEIMMHYCLDDLLDLHAELVENSLYTGMMFRSNSADFVERVMRCVTFHGTTSDQE